MTPESDVPAGRRHRSASARTLTVGLVLALAAVFGATLATILTADGQSAPPGGQDDGAGGPLGPVSGEVDEPLPGLTLDPLIPGGDRIALAAYAGAPLVVNFWATWCAPCVEEMPDLEAASREFAGRAAFLGVNVRDDVDDARAFVDELDITYDLAVDADGSAFEAVEGFGMPTTLFVDARGVVVYRHTGLLDAEALRRLLDRHLDVS